MFDHLLADLIGAVRDSFDRALLQRQAVEEHFEVDVFLGDVSWETSYSLPGEDEPPRVRVDLSIEWPTWSQTSYRSWSMGETPQEMPEAVVEVAMRVQRLSEAPPVDRVIAVLPAASPPLGAERLLRAAITIEEVRPDPEPGPGRGEDGYPKAPEHGPADAPPPREWAVEATYDGSLRFDETHLEDPETLEPVVGALTRWISSTLVQLADLRLSFLPPGPTDPSDPSSHAGPDPR